MQNERQNILSIYMFNVFIRNRFIDIYKRIFAC